MIVGIVPAAGHATRLGAPAQSKEVLTISGRPVMDYLVDRMEMAACDEIRVVTRPEKRDVRDHAERRGLAVVLGQPASVTASLLLGLGRGGPQDMVLFGFPDTLWDPLDGFCRLISEVEGGADVCLGVFRGREPARSDVVLGLVDRVLVKPLDPPTDAVWGCFAARRAALDGIDGHAEPGAFFDVLAGAGRVRGVRFDSEFVDIGTPEALAAVEATP
jgi:NDP-sugar pyrophosphorylase family protein